MTTQKGKKSDQYKSVFGNARKSSESTGQIADWASAAPAKLLDLISTVTSRGGAVRIGYTRDGGAYALGLYYGGEATTEYCRPSESLDEFLDRWIEVYKELPNSAGKAPTN